MSEHLADPSRLLTNDAASGAGASPDHAGSRASAESSDDPIAIAELVRGISEGRVAPVGLTGPVRQRCVNYLSLEGFSAYEISQVLRVNERTVCRDRAANRVEHAVAPRRYLVDELVGEFQEYTLASIQRLTRMSRDAQTPPFARLWAEEAISRVYERFLSATRKLHYLEPGTVRLNRSIKADPAEPAPESWYDTAMREHQETYQRMFGRPTSKAGNAKAGKK